jgi:hypothetical protein
MRYQRPEQRHGTSRLSSSAESQHGMGTARVKVNTTIGASDDVRYGLLRDGSTGRPVEPWSVRIT